MRNDCSVKQNLFMLIDCHNHLGVDLYFYCNGYSPYAQDLPALVTEGRHCGVDRWIVFPMVANLTFDVAEMRRAKLVPGGPERVPYAFENERMLREIYQLYPDLGRATLPFMILDPLRETAAQIAKLRALYQQFPFYGLKIQATMIKSDVGALLKEGRGFLELAEELNLPFIIHSSVTPEDTWSQASTILKVAAATPKVRFCLAHSCRYDRECLDRVAELPNTWFDCSAHRIHCEGVTRGLGFVAPEARRFRADYRDPTAVLRALAETYPTKLIWGSDTPFQSYVADIEGHYVSLRSTYAAETACVHALPEKLQRAIGQDNVLALLQLKDANLLPRG
jgi:predicted TIM-barrel fold metal-dependent hydrolase